MQWLQWMQSELSLEAWRQTEEGRQYMAWLEAEAALWQAQQAMALGDSWHQWQWERIRTDILLGCRPVGEPPDPAHVPWPHKLAARRGRVRICNPVMM